MRVRLLQARMHSQRKHSAFRMSHETGHPVPLGGIMQVRALDGLRPGQLPRKLQPQKQHISFEFPCLAPDSRLSFRLSRHRRGLACLGPDVWDTPRVRRARDRVMPSLLVCGCLRRAGRTGRAQPRADVAAEWHHEGLGASWT